MIERNTRIPFHISHQYHLYTYLSAVKIIHLKIFHRLPLFKHWPIFGFSKFFFFTFIYHLRSTVQSRSLSKRLMVAIYLNVSIRLNKVTIFEFNPGEEKSTRFFSFSGWSRHGILHSILCSNKHSIREDTNNRQEIVVDCELLSVVSSFWHYSRIYIGNQKTFKFDTYRGLISFVGLISFWFWVWISLVLVRF